MGTVYFWEISQMVMQILWLGCYWYYISQAGTMEKGAGKQAAGMILTFSVLALWVWIPLWGAWLLVTGILLLYDLFFDGEPFGRQWWGILLPGLCLCGSTLLPVETIFVSSGVILFVFLALLGSRRGSLRVGNGILTALLFILVSLFLGVCSYGDGLAAYPVFLWGGVLLEVLLALTVEGTLYAYKQGFAHQAEQFRKELLEHNYGEIREIYMDMRGWRHDYHNHMQVMKAQLAMGNLAGMGAYLDKLEQELDRVDTMVKSGNLLADAILNSKLTLARRQQIAVNCKVKLPEHLPVEDVDLCVILGNLLDNALEACSQIEEARFLRIYMTVNGEQLYLSVQNAAKEEPGFDARHYITRKRGNHGLGMKRVKAAVDKYQGYLRLANEAGIFAAEVTMPIRTGN